MRNSKSKQTLLWTLTFHEIMLVYCQILPYTVNQSNSKTIKSNPKAVTFFHKWCICRACFQQPILFLNRKAIKEVFFLRWFLHRCCIRKRYQHNIKNLLFTLKSCIRGKIIRRALMYYHICIEIQRPWRIIYNFRTRNGKKQIKCKCSVIIFVNIPIITFCVIWHFTVFMLVVQIYWSIK